MDQNSLKRKLRGTDTPLPAAKASKPAKAPKAPKPPKAKKNTTPPAVTPPADPGADNSGAGGSEQE